MAEIKTNPVLECETDRHDDHLCYMVSQGFHISDIEEFKSLIENAEYRCTHCGREAKKPFNLCEPEHL